ncbi:uncharacterized protein F5891DRAFT_1255171 [Suillus fuscotomentosus]|uniref:C3H1-type domain-containing protein n=1 Tax=Suillus fuscotomentosus TaxID=1912939 RepID=A0AAD4HFD6_9AGAM|nr:uncharacterized protein F5891DRAFT_1255171 [Suillus fuscotomentosus]KAG1894477.1 hypothetical protein F5891DRAFT_1255171 [Suillus fuscotomentosus]
MSQRPAPENSAHTSVGPSRSSKVGEVRRAWNARMCARGTKCRFPHGIELGDHQEHLEDVVPQQIETEEKSAMEARAAEIARSHAAETEARAAEIARARVAEAKACAAEIARVRAAETSTRAAEIAKEAAAKTVQNAVLGSIVTFSAGLELSHLITGFECCTLRIENLPPNVREDEIRRFHLVSVKPMPGGGRLSAEIITDAESGKALSLDLGGLEFRDGILTLEVSGYNSPGRTQPPDVLWVQVKVEVNTMPPGHFVPTFHDNSIKISFLSPTISDEEVKTFSGSDGVRRLTVRGGGGLFSEDVALMVPFKVRARVSSWEDADVVHTRLINHRIGNVSFWFRLPNPTQYSITVSTEQFHAQKPLWDALIGGIKNKRACMVHIHEQSAVVRMRLPGSKKEAIGALKTADYGESKAVEQARELIKDKLEQLSSLEYTKYSRSKLRETFGKDNVKFVISAWRITISGGEEARHALERLIQGSLSGPQTIPHPSGQQSCPICYANVSSSPLLLGRGHVYCSPCMRHFLTSALESGQFPHTCMGDETHPIPIPTIQQFLPQTPFNRLLEIAFHVYISRHHQPQASLAEAASPS